ncbi:MAG: ABC transporter permease [Vicinamibacteria bacterium]
MTAFLAWLRRDLHVAARNAPMFLGGLTQPILVILVFGNLMPRLGLVAADFAVVMVPGLMAISVLMSGVQGLLMPLSADLSGTREVDERILSPLPPLAVALERILAGALQSSLIGLLALPIMLFLMHEVRGFDLRPNWIILLPILLCCGFLASAFGLTLGTLVQPRYAGILFSILLGPMMLFGCAYYPWRAMDSMGFVQWLFCLNPLVFISEAMRLCVTPERPHMEAALIFTGLLLYGAFFTWTGTRLFEKRTIS